MNSEKPKLENEKLLSKTFIITTILISLLIPLIYYSLIEPFIIGFQIGQDIIMFWNALNDNVTNLYSVENFGFIYPVYFWYEFAIFGKYGIGSELVFYIFITLTKIIGFPVGIYLISKKYKLKNPWILLVILIPTFTFDVIVRNLNSFIFMISAIMIFYYDKKPFMAGLLFWLIGFKLTTIILLLFVVFKRNNIENKNTTTYFLTGIVLSIILIYIFFPISGLNVSEYIKHLIIDKRTNTDSFDIVLTISRSVHFDHMIWLSSIIFIFIYEYLQGNSSKYLYIITFPFLKKLKIIKSPTKNDDLVEWKQIFNSEQKQRKYWISIAFSVFVQLIFSLIGGLSYFLWVYSAN